MPYISKNHDKQERHDVFVKSVERITRDFPAMLGDRKVFQKLLSFIKVLSGSMRAAVLKSMDKYLYNCRENNNMRDIVEIA
jgi:hypothetical protein